MSVKMTPREPDPNMPPLQVTVGRADDGSYDTHTEVGGLAPAEVAYLLLSIAAAALDNSCHHVSGLAHPVRAAMWMIENHGYNHDGPVGQVDVESS